MLQASVAVHARYAPHITKYWLAFLQVTWLMFDPEIFRIKLTFQACHTRMGGEPCIGQAKILVDVSNGSDPN